PQRRAVAARRAGEGAHARHGDARQHAGRDDRAPQGRHRQVGGRDREGRNTEAGLTACRGTPLTCPQRVTRRNLARVAAGITRVVARASPSRSSAWRTKFLRAAWLPSLLSPGTPW